MGGSRHGEHHALLRGAVGEDADRLGRGRRSGAYHVWTKETIRQCFDLEGKGMASGSIHVALVRVSALVNTREFPYESK